MSRLKNAFDKKAFIGFVTAGDPSLEKTEEFVLAMAEAGAAVVEIGVPFSDPVAEGEVIERANIRALSVGTTTDKIFDLVKRLRTKTEVPLVLLTYANPVFIYGYGRFFKACGESGIDGIIIPDIPFEEKGELSDYAEKYGVDVISLIAPTSGDRIEKLARSAKGFVYCVSSMGVTGVRSALAENLKEIVGKIKTVTATPVAVGFGISAPKQAAEVCAYADGAIVGSAIVKIVEQYGDEATEHIRRYVADMCESI